MEESNIQFTLPNIGTSQMSRDDQGALIVNQATAAIVSAYLKHASFTYDILVKGGYNTSAQEMRFTQSELTSLINDVQGALKSF